MGASPLWSDAGNWDGLTVPGNGDALWFGGPTVHFESVFDLMRNFASLSFGADAQAFSMHLQGSGATLTLADAGILNGSANSGPFSQDFYADAGSVGGSIVFRDQALATRSAGIAIFGGSVLGAVGAKASFEGQSLVEGSLSVFAGSDGGYGVHALFSGTAVAAVSTGIASAGADSAIAGAEGVARFEGDASMAGSATNNPGTGAGFRGGRL